MSGPVRLALSFDGTTDPASFLAALCARLPMEPDEAVDATPRLARSELDGRDRNCDLAELLAAHASAPHQELVYSRVHRRRHRGGSWIVYLHFEPAENRTFYQNNSCILTHQELLAFTKRAGFSLMASGALWKSWIELPSSVLPRRSFADGHFGHGFCCAFRGEEGGHDRLVSRRWLEYGPWRLVRYEEEDVSIVEFHDFEADPETAVLQAAPGHVRMGIDENGGFIQTEFVWDHLHPTRYDPVEQVLEVMLSRRDPLPQEMLEAAAVKLWQPYEGRPVRQVEFIFHDERRARRNLHELWLRGLSCRVMNHRGDRRLTDDYEPPPPVVPDWVQRVRDREGF